MSMVESISVLVGHVHVLHQVNTAVVYTVVYCNAHLIIDLLQTWVN